MDSIGFSVQAYKAPEVRPTQQGTEQADAMKAIRKQRMQREVLSDPGKASELVSVEASPVYNAKGTVIQATSSFSAYA